MLADAHRVALWREVCASLGLPTTDAPPRWSDGSLRTTPWTGRALSMVASSSDIAHDIGHWLVADPARRRWPGFGLGYSYDGAGRILLGEVEDDVDGPDLLPPAARMGEEEAASIVGILLEAVVVGAKEASETRDDHSWLPGFVGDRWLGAVAGIPLPEYTCPALARAIALLPRALQAAMTGQALGEVAGVDRPERDRLAAIIALRAGELTADGAAISLVGVAAWPAAAPPPWAL